METIIQQLTNNQEALKSLRLGQSVSLKAAGTMLESTNVTGAGMEDMTPQLLNYIPIKDSFETTIIDLLPKIRVSSSSIVVVNELNDDGTVDAATAEGAAKNQIDKDDAVTNPAMKKITTYVKISKEMLTDIPFMNDQITRVLRRRIKKLISSLFLTDLIGATPTLIPAGLTAGTGATTIKDAIVGVTSNLQLINGYTPNLFLFNNPEYTKLYAESVANEMYQLPLIKPSAIVTAGNIVGIDTNLFPLYILNDLPISIGFEDDDFTKNLVSIRCESRLTWDLTGNCLNAIYNDTLAATLAALV